MTKKIVFLDIDGTILMSNHTYTDLTKDAITQLQQQDIEVFLATGRPIHELSDLAESLNIDSFIGYNGAYAIYNNETIVDEPMNKETVNRIADIAKEKNHEFIMYSNGKNYFKDIDSPALKYFSEVFQMSQNDVFSDEIADQILGITVMNVEKDEGLYAFAPHVHVSPVTVNGITNAYDIIRNNVNKGEAIKQVMQKLDIRKEDAIAFGDGMNDKEMLQTVGHGIAMGNANPELLAYADDQTTTVEESGIYYGLKKLGLVK